MKTPLAISIIVLTALLFGCSENQTKRTITIEDGKIGMIEYGSLMSKNSMEKRLKRSYEDSVYRVHLQGYKRDWNWHTSMNSPSGAWFYLRGTDTVPVNYIRALNITASENDKINALLFLITPEELAEIDKREFGYTKVDVTDKIAGLEIEGGRVYAYQAKQEYTYDGKKETNSVLSQCYIDRVAIACDSIGKEFRDEFEASTKSYNKETVASHLIWKDKK